MDRLRLGMDGNPDNSNAASHLGLEYAFSNGAGNQGGPNNNGNVLAQTISPLPGLIPFVQTYTYDDVNRLKMVEEKQGPTTTVKQAWGYDAYGNRWADPANTTSGFAGPMTQESHFVKATNRINTTALPGFDYDRAGNVTRQPGNLTYGYDGENRLRTYCETGASPCTESGAHTRYVYDADGRRVKKVSGSETVYYVYDAFGRLIAEYSTIPPAAGTAGTRYVVSDPLGSTRLLVNAVSGQVKGRYDYLPFGEELEAGTSGTPPRPQGIGYSPVIGDIRQKFGAKERDLETGLDFFEARYLASVQGRFTSPDPVYYQVMMAIDPQRFNLYAYARNNPLKFVDPNGERVYVRGNLDFLREEVLYQYAGGQETFDRHFQIQNGQVVLREGVDLSNANAGVQELAGIVNATETYLFFAGTNGNAAVDLFQSLRDTNGNLTQRGRDEFNHFTGNTDGNRGGYLVGTLGRAPALQPASLANGDPVFAIIAYNTNAVQTQTGVRNTDVERDAQLRGFGQRIRPVSFFIHESTENREFSRIGASQGNYDSAHQHAIAREAAIRRALGITGGFSGGLTDSRVPRIPLSNVKVPGRLR
jgi:RHS repeat-associated protein